MTALHVRRSTRQGGALIAGKSILPCVGRDDHGAPPKFDDKSGGPRRWSPGETVHRRPSRRRDRPALHTRMANRKIDFRALIDRAIEVIFRFLFFQEKYDHLSQSGTRFRRGYNGGCPPHSDGFEVLFGSFSFKKRNARPARTNEKRARRGRSPYPLTAPAATPLMIYF